MADQDDLLALDIGRQLFGFAALVGIVRFDLCAVGLEDLLVGLVGAQRLLVGQQEVAGVTVLDGNDIADAAELFDAFEQNDIHGQMLLTSRRREAGRYGVRA